MEQELTTAKELAEESRKNLQIARSGKNPELIGNEKDIVKSNMDLINSENAIKLSVKDINPPAQPINNNQKSVTVGDTYYNITTTGTNLTEQDFAELTRQGNENLINSIINNR